jgi:molecular chaperone HtpG
MEQRLSFQAEVGRLLDIVTHSLYTEKRIFLRELISNASDACDRLRYAALTQPELMGEAPFQITLKPNKTTRTLTVVDNGIGMNRDELVENLGTVARSGTRAFVAQLSGDAAKDSNLIGQFGVGFYSAFMVADSVVVLSRRAGEAQGWRWQSDGHGEFTIAEEADLAPGTQVIVHLKPDEDEFLDKARLKEIVRAYSEHIAFPVVLDAGDQEAEQIGSGQALWTRPKSEITAEQYAEFYRHVAHAFDDPWLTIHVKAEGTIEYNALLFVPAQRPFDLFEPERRHGVRLHVRRVFITADCAELLPGWLRFLRGIVDSADLPLNISRETLQHNPILARIRASLIKRVLGDLARRAKDDPADYAKFWDNFGAVLKEGLYEDREQRDALLELARFRSTRGDGLVGLAEYVEAMRPGQKAIYVLGGDDLALQRASPQLEGYRARGVEVLLLSDPIDEFWVPGLREFQGHAFKPVNQGAAELAAIPLLGEASAAPAADIGRLVAQVKLALGEVVKDVRASERLTDSAVCLVAEEGAMSMRLERLMKQHRQIDALGPRVLELNPRHPLIARLNEVIGKAEAADLTDAAHLLLDQARLLEGEPVPDPAAFAARLNRLVERGLAHTAT